jgi:hypothetical protein
MDHGYRYDTRRRTAAGDLTSTLSSLGGAGSQPDTPNTPDTTPTLASSRPRRNVKPPIRDDDPRYKVTSYGPRARNERANTALIDAAADPRTYEEAMSRADAAEWDAACDKERRAFERLGVYEVVPFIFGFGETESVGIDGNRYPSAIVRNWQE